MSLRRRAGAQCMVCMWYVLLSATSYASESDIYHYLRRPISYAVLELFLVALMCTILSESDSAPLMSEVNEELIAPTYT